MGGNQTHLGTIHACYGWQAKKQLATVTGTIKYTSDRYIRQCPSCHLLNAYLICSMQVAQYGPLRNDGECKVGVQNTQL